MLLAFISLSAAAAPWHPPLSANVKVPRTRNMDELAAFAKTIYNNHLGPVHDPPHQRKIEHFIVLLKENRAFDHIAGCMDLPGADSGATMKRNRSLPVDPKDPSKGFINVTCGSAKYVCNPGPGSSCWSQKFAKGAQVSTYPYSAQSDANSVLNGGRGTAVQMFSPAQVRDRRLPLLPLIPLLIPVFLQLPVKTAMAHSFGTFNKFFSSVPSASSPNHLFSQSATSCGAMTNVNYAKCNKEVLVLLPLVLLLLVPLLVRLLALTLALSCSRASSPSRS